MTDIINEEENTTPLPEEEQETVVVDNGQTYESMESAIIKLKMMLYQLRTML